MNSLMMPLLALALVTSGCGGFFGKGSYGTLTVVKKKIKSDQLNQTRDTLERVAKEVAAEGDTSLTQDEIARILQELEGIAEFADPKLQALELLDCLGQAVAGGSLSQEALNRIILGVGLDLGALVDKQRAEEVEEPQATSELLNRAVEVAREQGVPVEAVLKQAAKELSARPGATVEEVGKQIAELASLSDIPEDEIEESLDEGVASLRPCLEVSQVVSGVDYYCPDGSLRTGTREAAEGSTGELPDPATILAGVTILGVMGTYVPDFPEASNVLSTDTVNGSPGTYVPDFPEASNVLSTDTVNGSPGTYVPDFPEASNVLSTDTVNGSPGTLTLPTPSQVQASVTFGPASGQTGTLVVPAVGQVLDGVFFGGDSLLEGTLAGAQPNCTTDGEQNCTIPSSGAFAAADTTGFTEWDIRKKRDAGGNVKTFAGLSGKSKTCRNRANLSVYNNTTLPADTDGLVPDFFDTIEDNNGELTGIPLDYPDWTIPGVSGTHGEDFACGGIYATGETTTGMTGADGTLAHDADGNWQDLTPGIVPGGANSTNTDPGCNASDKHCVFRELISGLMVTEVSATMLTWQGAIDYCNTLGDTNAIPIIGGTAHSDWRLPTQKELMHLYNAGIRGLNQTSSLVTLFGDVDIGYFWSASSYSRNAAGAWSVFLRDGYAIQGDTTWSYPAVCVR